MTHDTMLKDHFRDKPECIIDFPPWLLSSQQIDEYRRLSRLAIVEMAGRDSVAAAVKAIETEEFTDLLPTYVYTGTEHGPWSSVETALHRLRHLLPELRIHGLLVLGSPGFWHALNGRFMSELSQRYGFYTPCVGCHLYLHAARIPLAMTLNAPIVAGEREHHDGAVKVNQTATALDCYQDLATHFKVPLRLPLRHIDEGKEIEMMLGLDWKQDDEQLGCVLSGNYKNSQNRVGITEEKVKTYLMEFALPLARKTVDAYGRKHVPNHLKLALDLIQTLGF